MDIWRINIILGKAISYLQEADIDDVFSSIYDSNINKKDRGGKLVIGDTVINYTVRESKRAKRASIVIGPGKVEVVVSPNTSDEFISNFVNSNRRNIYIKSSSVGKPEPRQRWLSGASIQFLGRGIQLIVIDADVKEPVVDYGIKLTVKVPRGLSPIDRENVVENAINEWMGKRLLVDAGVIVRKFSKILDIKSARVKLSRDKKFWARMERDGTIKLFHRLIELPPAVLEYVVVHEMVHLLYRNHSDEFWNAISVVLPDWRERHSWIKRYELEKKLW